MEKKYRIKHEYMGFLVAEYGGTPNYTSNILGGRQAMRFATKAEAQKVINRIAKHEDTDFPTDIYGRRHNHKKMYKIVDKY